MRYRDFLVGQAQNGRSPFNFTDMSVKQAWDSSWKTNCRTRIRGCDGLIALVGKNTLTADGALWEIQCANDEGLPVLGVWISKDDHAYVSQLKNCKVIEWTWDRIAAFLNSL